MHDVRALPCCILTQAPFIARRLLSEAAAQLTDADVAAMEAAAVGFPVHLTDVQSGLDVHSFFSRWSDSVAAVQHTGGGDTGVFLCESAACMCAGDPASGHEGDMLMAHVCMQ